MNVVSLGGTSWLAYEDDRGILIDAGKQPDGRNIVRGLHTLGVTISLLFLTHTHYDHTGGAEAVRRATGAAVAVGAPEAYMLQSGYTPIPAGTGRLGRALVRVSKRLPEARAHYHPVGGDIIEITDTGLRTNYGFEMQAFQLGAHTVGSVGLKIGEAFFAGDVVFGIGRVIYPPFADRPDDFAAAWRTILDSGAKIIYPGHGHPVSISRLEKEYTRRFN